MHHKNFFMVPNRIFDLELKPRDFTVYCCLLRHSDSKDGSCFYFNIWCRYGIGERNFMKEFNYELLRKRREKIIKLRAETNEQQHIGLGYVLTVDGKQYPVMACFPIGTDAGYAKSKFEYLINGQKS